MCYEYLYIYIYIYIYIYDYLFTLDESFVLYRTMADEISTITDNFLRHVNMSRIISCLEVRVS